MTGHERIIAALERRQPDAVPTFEWFIDKKVTQALAGTQDILEAVEALIHERLAEACRKRRGEC